MKENNNSKKREKEASPIFNILISGVGGQGVLSLASVIAEAAFIENFNVTTAETHGLSMRFGHLEVHVRFRKKKGKENRKEEEREKYQSPLIPSREANLVIGLETLETMRAAPFIGENSIVIFDTLSSIPVKMHLEKEEYPSTDYVVKYLKKYGKKIIPVPASKITKEKFGSTIYANIYILGVCVGLKLIPLKEKSIEEALGLLPAADINKKAFKFGIEYAKEMKIK